MDSIEKKIKRAEGLLALDMSDATKVLVNLKLEQLNAMNDYRKATGLSSEAQIIRELIDHGIQWAKATGIVPPE